MRKIIIIEISRLYEVEFYYNQLLDELSSVIQHKQNSSFKEVYDSIIVKYFFLPKKSW